MMGKPGVMRDWTGPGMGQGKREWHGWLDLNASETQWAMLSVCVRCCLL